MKISAKKRDSAKSVFHEATYQTSIGQQYTQARINPSSQSNNRIQLRTLQPQLHPWRLRDHQVVTLDPKQSSNIPPTSRNNRTILPEGNNPVYNTNCTNFILPHFYYHQTSMATPNDPKTQMTIFCEKHEILQKRIYSSQ